MWKKALAILSIPIVLLIGLSAVQATFIAASKTTGNSAGYLIGYYFGFGLCMALIAWLLFFWCRWIWRALARRQSAPLQWPE